MRVPTREITRSGYLLRREGPMAVFCVSLSAFTKCLSGAAREGSAVPGSRIQRPSRNPSKTRIGGTRSFAFNRDQRPVYGNCRYHVRILIGYKFAVCGGPPAGARMAFNRGYTHEGSRGWYKYACSGDSRAAT